MKLSSTTPPNEAIIDNAALRRSNKAIILEHSIHVLRASSAKALIICVVVNSRHRPSKLAVFCESTGRALFVVSFVVMMEIVPRSKTPLRQSCLKIKEGSTTMLQQKEPQFESNDKITITLATAQSELML